MNFHLVYDATTDSAAPLSALLFGLAGLAGVAIWFVYLKMRQRPLRTPIVFVFCCSILMILLSGVYRYELRQIANRPDTRVVEGPVAGHWTRQLRQVGRGFYLHWEGFSVQGVPFKYEQGAEQNYFHNAGPAPLEIKDGMRLRIRYLQERNGNEVSNNIVRIERAVD